MDNLSIKNLPNPVRLLLGLLSNQSPAAPEALHSTEMLCSVLLGTPLCRVCALSLPDHCLVFNFGGGYVLSLRFVFTATPSNGDCDLHVYDEVDGEESSRLEFMFPFCVEDYDVVGICCHIDEEHAVEVKNGVDIPSLLCYGYGSYQSHLGDRKRIKAYNCSYNGLSCEELQFNYKIDINGKDSTHVLQWARINAELHATTRNIKGKSNIGGPLLLIELAFLLRGVGAEFCWITNQNLQKEMRCYTVWNIRCWAE
ncbi:hypothetical protein RHGRI_028827 [Rhododendron griersonianum]|uniref:Di19 zinc-binding domain-containing protein n=1 Tax=Rhododendron griersonianum TaxID=479676 RepID=A0AAV6IHN8_9ERIC|nr:hypothetical protein RHGRI_028827 [Rhododendron griersonianum]KAG5528022.1 hypothetical protein RHGRI_028827 [Rhododendron griersonianum]KAG5528023.1 hypothetical protein RHGRI_028827 [Rhododendron griersonianum]